MVSRNHKGLPVLYSVLQRLRSTTNHVYSRCSLRPNVVQNVAKISPRLSLAYRAHARQLSPFRRSCTPLSRANTGRTSSSA
eukprot:1418463-Prymnesium_polylepis.1